MDTAQRTLLTQASREDVFKLAVQNAFNHIIVTDVDGNIIFANSAVERITGYPISEVIGKTPRLWGQQMHADFYAKLWDTIKVKKIPFEGEITNKRKNGQLYVAHTIISPILDDQKKLLGYIGTEQDISKEKEVDRMKTEFISITAHQLRTPLTALKWSIETLMDDTDVDDNQKELLKNSSVAIDHLVDLVTALLNITRIESGRLSIEPIPTNLEELARTKGKEILLATHSSDARISYAFSSDIPQINLDPKLIGEVIDNLLSNAFKYSTPDSQIMVGAKRNGDMVECWVENSGMGIPKEEQEKLFTKYFRAQSALKSKIEGNGLGLYFLKLIMDSSGGRIWCESIPGQTTRFIFTLPLAGMIEKKGEVGLS